MDRDHDLTSLEDQLRAARPEPRPEFLAEMAGRLRNAGDPAPRRTRSRLRLGLAVGFAALFAAAFAAMGALGYAGSAARSAFDGTVGNVEKVVRVDRKQNRVDRDAATTPSKPTPSAAAGTAGEAGPKAGGQSGGQTVSPRFSSPGAEASLFQYPRFVVVCVRFGHVGPFTIVLPRFLVPFFEPFIVNFGPCEGDGANGEDD